MDAEDEETFSALFFDAALAVSKPARFTRLLIEKFIMNSENLARLFTQGDDYRVLGTINVLYSRALQEDVAEATTIPHALAEYYLGEGRRGKLTLEEAQAGLAYRNDDRLWHEFILIGSEGSFVRERIADLEEAEREIDNFNRLKAGLDRRAGRLEDAEASLRRSLQAVLAAGPAARAKLAFVEYELGYLNYLQADILTAVRYFRDSYTHALEADDQVGAWIGRCVEYAVRQEQGHTSPSAAIKVFRAAKRVFTSQLTSTTRGNAARRWLMNSILHELQVEFDEGNSAAVDQLLDECRRSPAKEGVPEVAGYLDFWEALSAMLKPNVPQPSAVELLEGIVTKKKAAGTISQWYYLEAGARDLYVLGLAYQHAGDMTRAVGAWTEGLAFTGSMGNQIWRARCQAELDATTV